MDCLKRLNDVFPNWNTSQGIFSLIQRYTSQQIIPWGMDIFATPTSLDIAYHGLVSGNKIISPLLEKLLDENGELTDIQKRRLTESIYAMYMRKWKKLYDTMYVTYNPVENYNMVERMTDDETVHEYGKTLQRTDNLTHTKTGNDTETNNLQEQRTDNLSDQRTDNLSKSVDRTVTETHDTEETETPNLTNSTDNKIFGFNSSIGVDSDSQTVRATGTTTNAKTGTVETVTDETEANTGTQTTQHTGTSTNAKTGTVQLTHNTTDSDTGTQNTVSGGSDTSTRNYTLQRSGNIGVTTAQQMLESERKLWLWDYFYDVVFPDLDRMLTIPIY